MDVGDWLTPEFWGGLLQRATEWGVSAAPRILLLVIGMMLALRLVRAGLGRLERHLVESGGDAERSALEHRKRVETLISMVRTVAVLAVWVLFLMLLLVEVGINVGPLIAGAGVLGLAVGFGAQELVRDTITGFFILLENHLRTGDVAIINGQGGLVERIGLRTIQLRDMSGVVHVFQNGKVDTLANMTKDWSAALFDIGVAYKEDIDRVFELMKKVSEELRQDPDFASKIIEPMELFGVEEFGDSAVVIRARLKTVPIQQWSVAREYRRRLKYVFDAENVEIPFPHRTLYWGDASPRLQLDLGQGGTERSSTSGNGAQAAPTKGT